MTDSPEQLRKRGILILPVEGGEPAFDLERPEDHKEVKPAYGRLPLVTLEEPCDERAPYFAR